MMGLQSPYVFERASLGTLEWSEVFLNRLEPGSRVCSPTMQIKGFHIVKLSPASVLVSAVFAVAMGLLQIAGMPVLL